MIQLLKPCSACIVFTDIVEADTVRFSIDASNSVVTCHLLNSLAKLTILFVQSLMDIHKGTVRCSLH